MLNHRLVCAPTSLLDLIIIPNQHQLSWLYTISGIADSIANAPHQSGRATSTNPRLMLLVVSSLNRRCENLAHGSNTRTAPYLLRDCPGRDAAYSLLTQEDENGGLRFRFRITSDVRSVDPGACRGHDCEVVESGALSQR